MSEKPGRFALTRGEAARLLSVSEGTIDNMRSRGELSTIYPGGQPRIPYDEVRNLAGGHDADD